jgi:hypothetical protein
MPLTPMGLRNLSCIQTRIVKKRQIAEETYLSGTSFKMSTFFGKLALTATERRVN